MKKLRVEFLEEYKKFLVNEEKSQATIEKYLRDVRHFYHYLSGENLVDKQVTLEYKAHLTIEYKPASVNSMIAALNGFLEFLGWSEYKVKALKIQRKSFCPEEKELTRQEYKRLLEAANRKEDKRLFYIMQTICSTGIRVSELKYITVEGLKKGRVDTYSKGKCRTIFIPSKLRKDLLSYVKRRGKKQGTVFTTRQGKDVNRSNIWASMKRLCRETKIKKEKVFPHNLRHLFAFTYYNLKKDLVKLADILGHSNVETTRIYTISTGKEHEKQISSLGLVYT